MGILVAAVLISHILIANKNWRRGRDSNPRYGLTYTHFPGVLLKPLGHLSISNIQKLTSPPGGMDSVLTSFRTSPYGRTACVQNTRRATRFTLVFCRPSVRINVHTLSSVLMNQSYTSPHDGEQE